LEADCLGDLRIKSDNPNFQPEMLDILPATGGSRRDSGGLAQAAGVAGSLRHGFGVEARSLRCKLHSRSGPSLARDLGEFEIVANS